MLAPLGSPEWYGRRVGELRKMLAYWDEPGFWDDIEWGEDYDLELGEVEY